MAGEKSVRLFLLGDNTDAKSKIAAVDAAADELAAKNPDLKIGIDAAAAEAKLGIIKAELKETQDSANSNKSAFSDFGSILNTAFLGGISKNVDEMTLFQKAMMAVNVATGLGEPAVAGLAVVVGGLTAGVVAGGLGLGIFGLAAKSAFSQVTAANTAGTKLTGSLGELQTDLAQATKAYDAFGKAAAPGVAEVLAHAMGLIPIALKAAQQFLGPTETALDHIIGSIKSSMSSGGFQAWIDAFSKASGPNLQNLGTAILNIVKGIGGILQAFLPFSTTMTGGLDKITGEFAKWGDTLTSHSGFQSLVSMAKGDGPLLISAFGNIAKAAKNILSAMGGLSTFSNSHVLLEILNPVSAILAKLSGHPDLVNLALWALTAYTSFKKLNGVWTGVSGGLKAIQGGEGILGMLATKLGLVKVATEGETEAQEELDVAMDANPMGLIIIGIVALIAVFALLWTHSAAFRNFWIGCWKDIEGAAVDAWHFLDNDVIHPIETGIGDVVSWVESHWKLLATILATVLLGPVAGLVVFLATHWSEVTSDVSKLVTTVVGFFTRLPGQIMNELKALPGQMLSFGENIIKGLISGIENAVGGLLSTVSGLAGKVTSAFSSVLGIFSPSRVFMQHGKNIVLGLVAGIDGNASLATQSISRMASSAVNAGNARITGAAGANGAVNVNLEWGSGTSDQDIISAFKKAIRVRGGNPAVLGR